MSQLEIAKDIIAVYERHGWKLRRVLLSPLFRERLVQDDDDIFGNSILVDSDFDALWFARPSHEQREAWELRLLSQQAYALFEAFEADEAEEEREEARREMEHKMREYAHR
ncbi:MAG TPA: hypothetical protein VKD91_00375 [Pyrinomonadaceae bacterium]|nr:hypothetical protein [Pyrinomonadaceae bacterium]